MQMLSALRNVTVAVHLRAWRVGTTTHLGSVSPQSSSLFAAVAEETTLKITMEAVNGKEQRQLLQSEFKGSAK
jgi:hypothetical protein